MQRKPETIDDYLSTVGGDKRAALDELRHAIKAAAPRAEECISYGIPAFRLDGRVLVFFAAATRHCSFFPGAHPIETLKDELGAYSLSKGTIRFDPAEPLPARLVRRLVRARIAEQVLAATARKVRKRRESHVAELKTRETEASVDAYLDAIEPAERRDDCRTVSAIMRRVTKCEPRMWGPSIVGFGRYHYRYESGHEGDSCLAGYSSRKTDISIYLVGGFEGRERLLAQLGKHKTGKACLYVRRLADIEVPVLEKLIRNSVAEMKRRHPK